MLGPIRCQDIDYYGIQLRMVNPAKENTEENHKGYKNFTDLSVLGVSVGSNP